MRRMPPAVPPPIPCAPPTRQRLAWTAAVALALPVATASGDARAATPAGAPQPADYRAASTAAAHADLLGGDARAWHAAAPVTYGPESAQTTARLLWSARALYVRWDVQDDHPWATLTTRDSELWNEEVVEVFLDLDGSGTHYAEIELSPANVLCDVRMISPWPDKRMDLGWNAEGLESTVTWSYRSDGSVAGWTGIIAVPWTAFRTLPSAADVSRPPRPGDRWRVNLFRIERPAGPARPDEEVVFAAWSPPRGDGFHDPEAFRPLVFDGGAR
jgi:hypothetical protein